MAGAGSPASGLAAFLFYITQHPQRYARVCEEIRSTFPTRSDIKSGPAMASCVYLHACIRETLRLSPPFGGIFWREVKSQGIYIDGEHIPAGYDVGSGIYAMHHNEKDFRDPFAFKPERWFREDGGIPVTHASSYAYAPFSIGPRSCLGRELVMVELQLTIALLLWTCDVRSAVEGLQSQSQSKEALQSTHLADRMDEYQLEDHIVRFFDGPYIKLRRRVV